MYAVPAGGKKGCLSGNGNPSGQAILAGQGCAPSLSVLSSPYGTEAGPGGGTRSGRAAPGGRRALGGEGSSVATASRSVVMGRGGVWEVRNGTRKPSRAKTDSSRLDMARLSSGEVTPSSASTWASRIRIAARVVGSARSRTSNASASDASSTGSGAPARLGPSGAVMPGVVSRGAAAIRRGGMAVGSGQGGAPAVRSQVEPTRGASTRRAAVGSEGGEISYAAQRAPAAARWTGAA